MNVPDSTSDVEPDVAQLLDLLAVVGHASLATMTTLFGAPLPQPLWRTLAHRPGVSEKGDELLLLPPVAEQRLEELEQNDRLRYRQLHQQTLELLAKELPAEESTFE